MIKIHGFPTIFLILVASMSAFDISDSTDKYEIIKTTSSEYVKLLCRYHAIQYEIEVDAIDGVNEQILSSIVILRDICQKVRFNHICLFIMNEIKVLSDSFSSKNKIIQNLNMYSRKKRSMDNLVSTLQKTVLLAESTYNDLKNGIAEMQSLINMVRKTQNKFLDSFDYTNFYSLAQLTALNLRNLLHITNAIIDLFVNKNIQKIVELVPIDILKKNIFEISDFAQNENCRVPFNVNSVEILRLLRISKIALNKKNQALVINIKIPTISNSLFQIRTPISLPFSHKNLTYEAQSIYESYLICEEKFEIIYSIPFSHAEKSNCIALKSKTFMCNPKKAIQRTGILPLQTFLLPEFSNCNINDKNFFSDISKKIIECNLKRTANVNRIIRISSYEIYIYVTQPTFLQINCPDRKVNKQLNSSVFVYNLEVECSLHINNAFIADHSNRNVTIEAKQSNLFLSYSISKRDLMKKEPKEFDLKPSKEYHSEFNDLKEKVQEINETKNENKDENDPKKEKIEHDSYWIELYTVVGVYSAIILCLILANLYYKHKQTILHRWSIVRDTCISAVDNV